MHRLSRRGIALILALFTTAILIILSVSFLVLALGESRNSRTAGYEGAAVQAANFGIGYAINYMGRGGAIPGQPTVKVWDSVINPEDGLGFINVLHQPATFPHQTLPVRVSLSPEFPTNLNARRLAIANASGQLAFLPLGTDLQYTVYVDVVPIVNRGITSYRLLSTAEVWGRPQGPSPLARRRIEVRVLEESASSYLHFISNARSSNVQGQTEGEMGPDYNVPNTVSNIVYGRHQLLAGNIRIPPDYVENGPMRVDGQRYAEEGGVNATNLFAQASGNLVFGPGTNDASHRPRFDSLLSINGLANGYESSFGVNDTTIADQNSRFFPGGIKNGAVQMGLPDFEQAKTTWRQAAQNITQQGAVNGLIQVPTSSLMGIGTTPPQYQGRTTFASSAPSNPPVDEVAYVGNPFVERLELRNNVKVPVEPDYRPRFPNTELNFTNDAVTITNVSTLNGQTLGTPQTYKLSQFERGVIYVEGGNAVVTGGTNVTGQISVIAAERPDTPGTPGRERANATVLNAPIPNLDGTVTPGNTYNTTFNAAYNTSTISNETLYTFAAREATEYYRSKAQSIAEGPPIVDGKTRQQRYVDVLTPPYTQQQLLDLKRAGIVTANVPLADPGRKFFAPPSTILSPKVEREGNLIIAGDFKYNTTDRSTVVGLMAQNFVLLNDRDVNNDKTLNIDSVLMSGERSVQLDWDNTGRQPTATHQALITPGYNGTVKLKGSIVGEYIDVEGDYDKRGYFTQKFEHDAQLAYQRPPYFPKWNFKDLPGGFRYVITHYVDRGSLSTEDAAPAPSP